MRTSFISIVLALAGLTGAGSAQAAFQDVKVDLTNGNYLTADEISSKSMVTFGMAFGADGSGLTRVDKGDPASVITLSGKYHSNEHGWGNFTSTVSVDGPVKISMGTCAWGGDVTIKDASGSTVGTFNTNTGACYHQNKEANIASTIYKGGATTLTISGGSYTPYFAVETVDPSELVEDYAVNFSLGEYTDAGHILPAGEKVEKGKTFTVPANFTLYVPGKTLIGWTDGANIYKVGETVTVNNEMNLTPVFADNNVSLNDRNAEVAIRWDFQRRNGAPTVGEQGKTGWWVAQATVNGETIDVKMDYDTTNGKLANGAWTDWAQLNNGTVFTIPSCKGAIVGYESYSATTTTTVDGITVNTGGSNTASFTVGSPAETVDIVIGDGSYYRYISVTLPKVEQGGGQTFENAEATVAWPFNSSNYEEGVTTSPEGAFSMTAFDPGVCTYKGTKTSSEVKDVTFINFKSANGASDIVKWVIKPTKGLAFTPTRISFYIGRDGTDGAGDDVTVSGQAGEGDLVTLKVITPHRLNKVQADDKFGNRDNYTTLFDYTLTAEQQAALASGETFSLVMNNGYNNTKGCAYSDVKIYGTVSGTTETVQTYTLTAKANPEEAAKITVYPNIPEYEAGSEVKLTATRNFGYKFINWTDGEGKEVSNEAEFTYTVTANADLTANLTPVETYELKVSVEGGANDYQVQLIPAPTVIEGRKMYEAGTKVTLRALSNPVVSFTNWSDGQSSSEIVIDMAGDQAITAIFSSEDVLAGWDFYQSGNNGRPADFASSDNEGVALNLRDAEGNQSGWLDKSEVGGGYEGRPGGVNWKTDGLGKWYWETTVNAASFTDIKVAGAFVYNYNAYTTQKVEASLDGKEFETIGTVSLEGVKNWKDYEFILPEKFNYAPAVTIRWISDKESKLDGTTSNNDGICIGATYITGAAKLINDGTAPVLLSHVPAEGATGASASGKIILNFDEKVKAAEGATATLGALTLEPTVTGKTVMFPYKNLEYGTEYTFTLPAGAVMDLCDNATTKAVTIHFTTRTRPEVEKALYNFVVPDDGTFKEAIAAANNRADKNSRYIIFVKRGRHELPWSETETITNNGVTLPSPITYLNASNTSIIGEDRDETVIVNLMKDLTPAGTTYPIEGLHNVTTLYINGGVENVYLQDITLLNGMNDATGRGEALEDNGNKTICKNVTLWGYQDTYCSNNQKGRYYFEGGVMRGRTDYLCGKGDIFFNGVTFRQIAGGYLAVPSTPKQYGYIMRDCEIIGDGEGVSGHYTLGRPWGSGTPIALYINTKMTVIPSAIGWNEMSGGWPARFAEYNSFTANGNPIDLKDRKRSFGDANKGGIHENNPVLTAEEAANLTVETVMGADDEWDPTFYTEQAPAPTNVKADGNKLTWDDSKYAALWAVCADGKVVAFTTEPSFDLSTIDSAKAETVYSVRAANQMGGLSEAVKADGSTGVENLTAGSAVSVEYYNLQGIRTNASAKGVVIRVETMSDGSVRTSKVVLR